MAEARHAEYTVDEYLRLEGFANVKHEYLDGAVHAIAGGRPEHGAIAMRVAAAWPPSSADVRIRVAATGAPDLPRPLGRLALGHRGRQLYGAWQPREDESSSLARHRLELLLSCETA